MKGGRMAGVGRPGRQSERWVEWWWIVRGEPYRSVAELRGLGDSEAVAIYRRAARRAWASGRMGRGMLGFCATAALLILGRVALSGAHAAWQIILHFLLLIGLFIAFHAFQLPAIRRCVRAELGTHCPECDYDLRGGHERCPECGRIVKRKPEQRQGSQGAIGATEEDGTADGGG